MYLKLHNFIQNVRITGWYQVLGRILFSKNWPQRSTWYFKFTKLPEFGVWGHQFSYSMFLVSYHSTTILSISKEDLEREGGHLLIKKTGFPFPVDMLNFPFSSGERECVGDFQMSRASRLIPTHSQHKTNLWVPRCMEGRFGILPKIQVGLSKWFLPEALQHGARWVHLRIKWYDATSWSSKGRYNKIL